jgi:hypothetical protein
MKKTATKPKAKAVAGKPATPKTPPKAPKALASSHDPLRSLLRGTHSAKVCAR